MKNPLKANTIEELTAIVLNRPTFFFDRKFKMLHYTSSDINVLSEDTNSRFGETIYIDVNLYDRINEVWPKRPAFKGSSTFNRVGAKTLVYLLKKLGVKDIEEQVENKIAEYIRVANIKSRNARRSNLAGNIDDMLEKLTSPQTAEILSGDILSNAVEALRNIKITLSLSEESIE